MIYLSLIINFILFFIIVDISNRIRELERETKKD
jgi:hypothetical protein